MTTQEKVENLIKEGVKHPLPAGITDASEIQKLFRNYTDALASTSEELTCKVQEHIQSYYKPLTIVYTKPHTYVMYRGIKIPTKGLYSQSKNKFTAKIVRKVYLKPMSVIPAEDPNDKHRINIDMVFNTIDQK